MPKTLDPWLDVESALKRAFGADCPILRLLALRARLSCRHAFGAMTAERSLVFGHFRRGTNVKPEVNAWIAAQRLNRLAQAAVAEAMAPLMLW